MKNINIKSIDELNLQKIIPSKLKEFRNQANLSLRDVAQLLNMSASMVSLWEQGKNEPSYEQLIRLCQIYKIELSDLTSVKKMDSKLSPHELVLIEKYRKADKEVQFVIEKILQITSKNKK